MEDTIKLSKMEIQSNHNRVAQAENLIKQLPDDHDGRNSWLMNYGTSLTAQDIRTNDNQKRRDGGYSPRDLTWNFTTSCLNGVR